MILEAFTLWGINPEPWTPPTASLIRRGGKTIPVLSKSAQVTAFQEAVKEELESQYDGAPITDPVALNFYFWRQQASVETESGRKRRRKVADATNCQKALEDALQGVLIGNDREVVGVTSWMMEQGADVEPCIVIQLVAPPVMPKPIRSPKPVVEAIKTKERPGAEDLF